MDLLIFMLAMSARLAIEHAWITVLGLLLIVVGLLFHIAWLRATR